LSQPLINPFTDALEWWDEEHWIKNGNYEQFLTAKYSFPAIVYKINEKVARSEPNFNVYRTAYMVMQEFYPDRLNDVSGITWSFNNHPDTTFKDIQTVLIHCAEVWRRHHANPS
jgi:hypothetical protein